MKRGGRCADRLMRSVLALGAPLLLCFEAKTAWPESEKEARVTVVVHDVKLLPEDEKPRPAVLNDTVKDDTAVRTGNDSRSELTFVDLTITRLGSNTIFTFNRAGRRVQLNSGSILLRVPKNSGGANIKTDACSVAITGTTVILEATQSGHNTLAVLEGGARMSLNKYPTEASFAHGGQLLDVPPGAKKMPKPININVRGVMKSHPLITNFPALPSEAEIYAGSSGGSSPQNPVVYNPRPTGPIGPAGPAGPNGPNGPIGNPGGNYPAGGGNNPIGPNYPGKGKSPGGVNSPNGPANPGKGPGGKKGKKKPSAPNNPKGGGGANAGGHNPGGTPSPIGKVGKTGTGKLPLFKGIGPPAGNQPQPSPTPKRHKLKNGQQPPP